MVMVVLTLTVGVARSTEVITLSPPEKYSLSQGVATIRFAQVDDGHLHRFEYTAKDGTVMRFIIIKKNGGAYGVGLDACEPSTFHHERIPRTPAVLVSPESTETLFSNHVPTIGILVEPAIT